MWLPRPPPARKVSLLRSPVTFILPCPRGHFSVFTLTTVCFFKCSLLSKTLFSPGLSPPSLISVTLLLPTFVKLRFLTSTQVPPTTFFCVLPHNSLINFHGFKYHLYATGLHFFPLPLPLSSRFTYLIVCLISLLGGVGSFRLNMSQI